MEESKMAVKIRLRRMGQKKAPFYRIVVSDSRSPRDGKFIEEIGYYYAPFLDHFKDNLLPILEAGKKVFQELSHLISTLPATDDSRQRSESAYDELRTNYGYLFE